MTNATARARVVRALRPQDRWNTPRGLFAELDAEFDFALDVAADAGNALCPLWFGAEENGLTKPWAPHICWMNPPYSLIEPWTKKAAAEARAGAVVVGLLPVRTDLAWFHRDVLAEGAEVRFVRGRLKFSEGGSAPFPSMVVVWGNS
jgi:phage N-6-adenine-methyltransferase